jgi:hypothetical protein
VFESRRPDHPIKPLVGFDHLSLGIKVTDEVTKSGSPGAISALVTAGRGLFPRQQDCDRRAGLGGLLRSQVVALAPLVV